MFSIWWAFSRYGALGAPRHAARVRFATIAALFFLGACTGSNEVWHNNAAPDQIPTFRQVSPPDIYAFAGAAVFHAVVAVGDNGTVMRSTDNGTHWSPVAQQATASQLTHVATARDGVMWAVGDHGAIIRSRDGGQTWSAVPKTGTQDHLRFVLPVSDQVLVAFGVGGTVVRSIDAGDSWFAVQSHVTTTLRHAIRIDKRRLLAVGELGVMIRSDNEGESWTATESKLNNVSQVLATPGGALLAVGAGIARTHGFDQEWGAVPLPGTDTGHSPGAPFTQVVASPTGTLIAVSPQVNLYSHDDGRSWTIAQLPSKPEGMERAFSRPQGSFAVLAQGRAAYSNDEGKSWLPATVPDTGPMLATFTAPDGSFLAAGRAGAIWKSTDQGSSWTAVTQAGTSAPLHGAATGANNAIVAVGEWGAIMRSTDGGNAWMKIASPTDDTLHTVLTQASDRWIAIGQSGAILQSATGGATWSPANTPPSNDALRYMMPTGREGVLIVVGDGGTIFRSTNGGLDWTRASNTDPSALYHVISHRGLLIAVGDNGTVVRSMNNGKDWTRAHNDGSERMLFRVAAVGDALVACGGDGTIVRSIDLGANWTPVKTPISDDFEDMLVVREDLLIVKGHHMGDNAGSSIIRSTDAGKTWTQVAVPIFRGRWFSDIVRQQNGVLIGVGARIVRSLDDGVNWTEVPKQFVQSLAMALIAPDGHVFAVGQNGLVVRDTPDRRAPTIRRLVHSYNMAGFPVIRISLDDPDKTCGSGACLSAWGRSTLDFKNHRAATAKLPAPALVQAGSAGEYELTIDPASIGASPPEPIYLSLAVAVPGHYLGYKNADGSDFLIPNNPDPVWKQTWFQLAAPPAAALLLLLLVASFRPLWLLPMMAQQETLEKHGVGGVAGTGVTLVAKLLLPLLVRQPGVLNAWVQHHEKPMRLAFESTVQDPSGHGGYWALPVTGPDGHQLTPSPATLAEFFKTQRAFIDIVGQGGAGKTSLALQIRVWLAGGRLTSHATCAVFIDEDFTDLFTIIKAKVNAALGQKAPTDQFLKALLRHGRLAIFIDRLSERSPATREAVARTYQSISPKIIVCTSRLPVALDGAHKITLRPVPLDPATLLDFVLEQLREANARHLFPDPGQLVQFIHNMAPHASAPASTPRVIPLLVTIVVAQAILSARSHGTAALGHLPKNVPEVYFSYVEKLDETRRDQPSAPGLTPGALIRLAATIIAFVEIGNNFRPGPVNTVAVNAALMADHRIAATGVDFIDRFCQNGLLGRKITGTESFVEFILDPLAECLAAYSHASQCGRNPTKWRDLVQDVVANGDEAQGFMSALRINHEAYASEFGFPAVRFQDSS